MAMVMDCWWLVHSNYLKIKFVNNAILYYAMVFWGHLYTASLKTSWTRSGQTQNKSYLGRIILKILSFVIMFYGRKLLHETYDRFDIKDGSMD